MLTFEKKYFVGAVVIFLVEVFIAIYVEDQIIRPFVGDFLVVMLVYCFVRCFLNISLINAAIFTLLFAYAVEISQYLGLVDLLGIGHIKIVRIVLGSSFDWLDMLSYTLGVVVIWWIEKKN